MRMTKNTIVVIDDEPQIRKLLKIVLESNGYKAVMASTGTEGRNLAANHSPALVLLDIGLPDKNGHNVLKDFREWYENPIIMLSVQDSEKDIVKALDNGATDYLCKPFRTGELLARIRSSIRHSQRNMQQPHILIGSIEIDLLARVVRRQNQVVNLTTTEYNLFKLLARNQGKVLTHQYILTQVWGVGAQQETQYLRVFVAQLRKKLEENPNKPEHIITENGVGYRLI